MGLTILDKRAPKGNVWVAADSGPPIMMTAPSPELLALYQDGQPLRYAIPGGWTLEHTEPEPVVEIDVPVIDRATGEPVVLEVECGAGHVHGSWDAAADCDRAQPAGALQDLTDDDLARMDRETRPALHIEKALLAQGYSAEYAARRAVEWRDSPNWRRP